MFFRMPADPYRALSRHSRPGSRIASVARRAQWRAHRGADLYKRDEHHAGDRKALELDDPKASTVIYTQPDKGRRRSFVIWNTVSTILLGLTPSPWRTYANGAGWNPEQTLSGYELTFSSKDLNQAIFAGSEVAFKELGCAVSRFAPNNAAGIKLGKLAKANRDSIDFLWIVLHNYDLATNTRGEAMYRGELRGALIDSASAKTWLTYRRLVKSPTLQVASQTKIERGEGKPTLFRLSITPEEIVKTQKAIAEQVRKDLVEWPNKDAKKHAAQRPGISPLE